MSVTGYQFKLLPTASAARLGSKTAANCRWLWNWALAFRQDVWMAAKTCGATGPAEHMGYVYMSRQLAGLKAEYPWLAESPHHALQQTLIDLDKAYRAFFEGRAGHPKFRKKGNRESFRFPDPKQFVVENDWVKLPKFGWIRFDKSRPIVGTIKNITVTRDGERWSIAFCCEGEYRLPNYGGEGVGCDFGIKNDLTLSNGDILSLGAPSREDWKKLSILQALASRKTKGSARWMRAQARVAKQHRRIANRRLDKQHKTSHQLATQHSYVVLEDLKIKNMTASAGGTVLAPGANVAAKSGLNRELLARGFGQFRIMLAYKCERAGIPFLLVNPAFTSQTCPQCHHCAPENRENQAAFKCVACGLVGNADWIAATNIKAAGQVAIARKYSEDTSKAQRPRRPCMKTRTHLRDRSVAGSPGIPAKVAKAA